MSDTYHASRMTKVAWCLRRVCKLNIAKDPHKLQLKLQTIQLMSIHAKTFFQRFCQQILDTGTDFLNNFFLEKSWQFKL